MEILLKDSAKYTSFNFQGKESKFEEIVFSQYKELFGEKTILFTKQKINTINNIGTIPDAFVIDFINEKWFIVEIELKDHDVYKHIVPQLTKFLSALNNPITKKQLIKSFEKEINIDSFKRALVLSNGKNEIFKIISEIVDKDPELIIILDQQHNELNSIKKNLPFKTIINIFKVFCRYKYGLGDNIFQIEPLFTEVEEHNLVENKSNKLSIAKKEKNITNKLSDDYATKAIYGLENSNNQISKMLQYIKDKKELTQSDLLKFMKQLTNKPTLIVSSGTFSGPYGALKKAGLIKDDGKGALKKIIFIKDYKE